MTNETAPDLREQIAEAAADWAYAYPIASWSLASGDAAVSLAKTWGNQAANAILLNGLQRRFDEQADEIAKLREGIAEANAYGNAAQKRLAESHSENAQLRERAEQAEAERDRLDVRINEIATAFSNANRLHHVDQTSNTCTTCIRTYPCPTVKALNAIDDQASVVIAERDELKATVARVRAVHHLIEWVSLSDVCHRHHAFRTYGPTAENIAIADVCPDCQPRRYMNCVCADDDCPTIAALDQPEEGDRV